MEDFILYKAFPSGGKVSLMTGLDKTSSDYDDLISIACCFARTGRDVKVLAPVHYKDPSILVCLDHLSELDMSESARTCLWMGCSMSMRVTFVLFLREN